MMKRKGILKELAKRTIIENIIKSSTGNTTGHPGTAPPGEQGRGRYGSTTDRRPEDVWKVLVLDHFSSKVVSSCCSMHDITAEGVTLVEDLHKKREPLPYLEAIYILKPSEETIKLLVKDLDSTPTIYRAYHIFFIEMCPEALFDKLCSGLNVNRIKSLKEVYMSFIPRENHVFTIEGNSNINRTYYNKDEGDEGNILIQNMAGQLASLCACLGENPAIRYRSACPKNLKLAQALEKKLLEYKAIESSLGEGPDKARSELIILDRGFDCSSPVLHELTLGAMIHDIKKVENGIYKYKGSNGEEKETFLDDNDDELWSELKYMHIAEASQKVPEEYKKFVESKNVSTRGDPNVGIRDLQMMVKKLPQCQKEINMFSTQLGLVGDCMKEFERLKKLCAVEQDLATGTNSDREKVKDIMSQMNPILLDVNPTTGFSDYEKLRLIILYIISKNGVPDDSLSKLLTHANIDISLKDIVMNMAKLGPNVVITGGVRKEILELERKDRDSEGTRYVLSRWTPILKDIIEFVVDDRLDKKNFPYQSNRNLDSGYKVPVSTRFIGQWHPNKIGQPIRSLPRLIIFVVGGITHSEIRSVYEVNKIQGEWEVIIGSTEILTPDTFLDGLKEI